MKRINTIIVLMVVTLFVSGFSVNSAFALPNLALISFDTTVIGGVDDEMIMHGKIKNVSFFDAVTAKLKINVLEIQQGQGLLICWGETCYGMVTKTGEIEFSDPYTLKAQQESGPNFKCGIEQGGVTGKIKVVFTFFDVNNPADSATFTSQAEVTATGIDPVETELSLYPMPVNDWLYIDLASDKYPYDKYSSLDIIDMTGLKVRTMSMRDGLGAFAVNTNDLSNGIYMLSLFCKDGTIETRKFIISR